MQEKRNYGYRPHYKNARMVKKCSIRALSDAIGLSSVVISSIETGRLPEPLDYRGKVIMALGLPDDFFSSIPLFMSNDPIVDTKTKKEYRVIVSADKGRLGEEDIPAYAYQSKEDGVILFCEKSTVEDGRFSLVV